MTVKCFAPEVKASLNLTLSNLLSQVSAVEGLTPIRITFFSNAQQDEELEQERQALKPIIADHFGNSIPTWNLIGQTPLSTNHCQPFPSEPYSLGAEATYLEIDKADIQFKMFENRPYVVVEKDSVKTMYVSGMRNSYTYDVIEQCEETFAKISRLMVYENMPINSIARQWNYVRKIVGVVGEFQNYQQFNDARSNYYNQTTWPDGYPAATGIGVICGKISVDFDAMTGVETKAVDNLLQVAAHAYSQEVLIGKKAIYKTTPKFERAKLAGDTLYISGTASITGEDSIGIDDIEKQTHVTLDNIDHLVEQGGTSKMQSLRVYLKKPSFLEPARKIVEQRYGSDIEAIYTVSDVCRDELLIEIEGLSYKG